MDLAHCAPAGRSQTNSFCVSLGAAANSLVSKPNILRVWLLWGSCTFHLELANQTNDWELISPNVELDKEYILHIIFTLSLSVIPCCIPCLLPLQAQLRINIRCLSLGKPEKKKKNQKQNSSSSLLTNPSRIHPLISVTASLWQTQTLSRCFHHDINNKN